MIPDPLNQLSIAAIDALAAQTSTFTGAAFATAGYNGNILFGLLSAIGTGNSDNTMSGKLQTCATSGGSYVDITGATFTQVTHTVSGLFTCSLDSRLSLGFVKFVGTIAGTTPSFVCGTFAQGQKQVEPS